MRLFCRLFLCFSLLQTPYLYAEGWDYVGDLESSNSKAASMDDLLELQKIVQEASPEDFKLLSQLAYDIYLQNPQKIFHGLELDGIISQGRMDFAQKILNQFRKIKLDQKEALEKKLEEEREELRNAQRAENLTLGKKIFASSPLAPENISHNVFPKMVQQLITQVLLRDELRSNPKYLETEQGKLRYNHLLQIFLPQQSSTIRLPGESAEVTYGKDSWPELAEHFKDSTGLPNLKEYMLLLAEETAISLKQAYLAKQQGQMDKVQEYTDRASVFVTAAYLAAGNHLGHRPFLLQKQVEIGGGVFILSLLGAVGTNIMNPDLFAHLKIGATSWLILSMGLFFRAVSQRDWTFDKLRYDSFSKNVDPKNQKNLEEYRKKRSQYWLPKFIQNRWHNKLSQQSLRIFWNGIGRNLELKSYSFPGFENSMSYNRFFSFDSPKFPWGREVFNQSESAADWFLSAMEKLNGRRTDLAAPFEKQGQATLGKSLSCDKIFPGQ